MIHKNWENLIKPAQLEVRPGNDPQRQATLIAEPLERGFGQLDRHDALPERLW